MTEILDFLQGNAWLNLIFLVLSILSLLVSFILYFLGKKERRPVYNSKSFNLINEKISKIGSLKITYDKRSIETLTLTKFALWNEGRETINNADVASSDPLRLYIDNRYEILHAEIVYQKKPNNFSISINQDRKMVPIRFDYFHTREGVVLNLYHTGTSSTDISISGTIKGVNNIPRGVLEEADLLYLLFEKTVFKVLPPPKEMNLIYKATLFIFVTLMLPLEIIVMLIEFLLRLYRRAPKEYKLEDSD